MRRLKALGAVILLCIVSLLSPSCDMGGTMYTDEELASMYDIELAQNGASVVSGKSFDPGVSIDLSVSMSEEAPEPAKLDVILSYPDGREAARLSFVVGSAAQPEGAVAVDGLIDDLPPIKVPSDLEPGYYILQTYLYGESGEALSSAETVLLIFDGRIDAPGLTVYPAAARPGRVSLLRVEAAHDAGLDPWVRWTVDGVVKDEGYWSARSDRLALRAPAAAGVYVARADIYPFKPPVGRTVPAYAFAEAKLPVPATVAADSALGALDAYSEFLFEGDLADDGPRERSAEPEALGLPYLETYSSGYGFALGAGLGVLSSEPLLPVSNGRIEPFSLVFALAPLRAADGAAKGSLLFSSKAPNGSTAFAVGIADGYPFVEAGGVRATASAQLPVSFSRLAVSLSPTEAGTSVAFYIDERFAGEGNVPASPFEASPGASVIAGEYGYEAVYDDVAVIRGAYPAYRMAEYAAKRNALVAASGFEGGALGPAIELSGDATLADGSLRLEDGSSALLGVEGRAPAAGLALKIGVESGVAVASLRLSNESVLRIRSDGTVSLDQSPLGRLSLSYGSLMSVAIDSTGDKLNIVAESGDSITMPGSVAKDARWAVSCVPGTVLVLRSVSAWDFDPSAWQQAANPDEEKGASPSVKIARAAFTPIVREGT